MRPSLDKRRPLDSFLIVILLAACWLPGCSSDGDTDSETHWQSEALESCRDNSDCANGRSCLCGVCTSTCDEQNQCAQLDSAATCATTADDLNDACSSQISGAAGACFETCQTNAECEQRDSKLQCMGGYCMRLLEPTPTDAGDIIDTPDSDVDPDCHVDCFGGLRCEDGVVYQLPYGPMPCSEGSSCGPGDQVGTCGNGCKTSSMDVADAGGDWDMICEEPRLCGDGVDCCAPEVEALLNIPYTGDEGVGPNATPDSIPFHVYNGVQLDRNAVTEGTWVGTRALAQSEMIECPGNAAELGLPCEIDQVGVFETTDGTTVEFVIGVPVSILEALPTGVAAEIDTTDGLAIRRADDDTLILGNGGPHTTAESTEYQRTFSGFEITLAPDPNDMSTALCLAEPDFCNRMLRIDALEIHADTTHELAPGESVTFAAAGRTYRLWHVVSMQRYIGEEWGTGEPECSDGTSPKASFIVAQDGQ